MFLDLRAVPEDTVIESDVCIVGGGAAGITLALELRSAGCRVSLLESGGLDFDDDIQNLNDADSVGRQKADLHWTRLRYFGGTTGHWGGNCAPLDDHDFRMRSWVPDSGWPFDREELDACYPRAYAYCELPSSNFTADYWAEQFRVFRDRRLPLDKTLFSEKIFLKSPPTRFGDVYREELSKDDCPCTVYLHANVTEIETGWDCTEVTGLSTRGLDGKRHRFTARLFILASGIENARLLLLSNRHRPNGLGNDHDLVGRYFMAHTTLRSGLALLSLPEGCASFYSTLGWETKFLTENYPFIASFQPTAKAQEDACTLNATVFFEESYDGERAKGFSEFRRLLRELRYGKIPDNFEAGVGAVICDLDEVVTALYSRATDSKGHKILQTRYFCEQAPNPESRVRLGEGRDALGQPKLTIDWNLTELDKRTILRTQDLLARQFGALGLGRLKNEFGTETDDWPGGVHTSAHFMGTTRMHDDPRCGVVDRDCRVHGIANLYVAGGSVFPTSGATMPTINIVALAVRLADHIRGVLA